MLAEEGAPRIIPFGVKMVAPVIMTFGTRRAEGALPARHPQLRGVVVPGLLRAGRRLRPRQPAHARGARDGDHYIVNGQKTWTTFAHCGDWIFCLVRTNPDAKPQEGISFLLIDMKTPGVTVRPIIMLDGAHARERRVLRQRARCRSTTCIGEENEGWTYAKFLLAHERTGIADVPRQARSASVAHRLAGDDGS